MKTIFTWIWNILKNIWMFFEKYGFTIFAICTFIMCIVTIILDVILFVRKLKEDKNLSYAKIKEEVMHDLDLHGSPSDDFDNNNDSDLSNENDDLPL